MFEYQFIQNAFVVSVLASIAAGIMGSYIYSKRMSLISGSIAHASFGGLGLGYFLGINPLYGAISFSLFFSALIGYLRKKSIRLDSLLTFLWSIGMAIGLLFIFMTDGYATDLFTFLFGNILLVSRGDMIFILLLDIVILVVVFLMYNSFLSATFDEEYTEVRNMPLNLIYIVLFSLIGLTIVSTLRVVGIVLMIAILTIPPAIASAFVKRLKHIMILSTILILIATVGGIFVSYYLNIPTGIIIILIISILYLLSLFKRDKGKR